MFVQVLITFFPQTFQLFVCFEEESVSFFCCSMYIHIGMVNQCREFEGQYLNIITKYTLSFKRKGQSIFSYVKKVMSKGKTIFPQIFLLVSFLVIVIDCAFLNQYDYKNDRKYLL